MQLRVRIGIIGNFEERKKDVVDDLLEVRHELVQFEDITAKSKRNSMNSSSNALKNHACVSYHQ